MTPLFRSPAARWAILAALLLTAISATAVVAQDEALGGKLRSGETVTIPAGETVEGDLYASGGTIVVDGTVDGDLVAAAGDVRVNGSVTGDLIAAGGNVTVAGSVDGDARVAGGQVNVSGEIGEDLVVLGGQASIGAAGSVGGDVIVGAGQLTIAGAVAGSVQGGAGTYERTGTIGGEENVVVGEEQEPEPAPVTNPVLDAIRHFIVVLLIGALALWLMPGLTRAAAELVRRRPLASLGFGLLAFLGWLLGIIGVLIVIIVAALLLGLIGFGELVALIIFAGLVAILVATFVLWVVAAYLADAVVGLGLVGFVRPSPGSRWIDLGLLAAGAAIVVILTSLPYAGGWIKLVVAILGLGALTLAGRSGWRFRRAAAAPVTLPSEA